MPSGFFLLQIYTPLTLIVFCSWVSFWLVKTEKVQSVIFIYQSIIFIHLSIYLFIYLIHLFLYFHLYISLSIYLPIYLSSLYSYINLSIHECLSIYPSIFLPFFLYLFFPSFHLPFFLSSFFLSPSFSFFLFISRVGRCQPGPPWARPPSSPSSTSGLVANLSLR